MISIQLIDEVNNAILNPAVIYMFKVSNGNTRTMCEIYSKLTIKIAERCIHNAEKNSENYRAQQKQRR